MTYVDGFVAGLAILALSLLQFGPHALPRPLIWLGALIGVYHIVSGPIQLAISHSPAGATGPIGVVLLLVWILAVAAVMVIRPVRSAKAQPAGLDLRSLAGFLAVARQGPGHAGRQGPVPRAYLVTAS